MGGGSGGGQQATNTSGIPTWAQGYHKNLLENAENFAYGQDYGYYGWDRLPGTDGPDDPGSFDPSSRIAGFSPEELAGKGARADLFNAGDPYGEAATQGLGQAAAQTGSIQDVQSGYGAKNDFWYGGFDQAAADQYMSPYQQSVTDSALGEAREEYERQQQRRAAGRVASGARGGYRDALQGLMGDSEQANTLAQIQAKGSQAAFLNAQEQYERDRGARMAAELSGDQSAYRSGQLGLQADQANQAMGLSKAQMYSDLGMRTNELGQSMQDRELSRITSLEAAGERERMMNQAIKDLSYEEFERLRNYPKEQLSFMAEMLQGVPSQQTNYSQKPSLASNLIGLGLGGAGVYNMFKG